MQKAKDKYHNYGGKEKAAECHLANKDSIKEKANNKYKSLSEEEEEAKRKYGQDRYKKIKKNQANFVKYKNELLLV